MPCRSTDHPACALGALKGTVVVVLASLAFPVAAEAQGVGCLLQPAGAPARQVLQCRDGVTIEAEAGADYTLLDRDQDGQADAASLQNRALFIDGPARPRRNGFQVTTPQAIAAVRGTQWAVDVAGAKTSVFVVSGRVAVRRSSSRAGVELGPGEGVDVEAGTGPLTVRRWPIARANALMARFGRQLR